MGSSRKPDPYLVDEDTAPLTDEEIKRLRPANEVFAELGIPLPRPRGRPKKANPKVQVTLRLDPDVVARYKASGKGWQTRLNDDLRKITGLK